MDYDTAMKKINAKFDALVRFITDKPVSELTKSDYDILVSEFWRRRNSIEVEESRKKMMEALVGMSGFPCKGS